ncbi:hypothetical protein A9Q81_15805 [Gammaproteobacteria bacterium 42_54_T18]|nr:hypothetical protein A9Q81_15805 [Gammaproteobacteria bacterium 42_54_T18]
MAKAFVIRNQDGQYLTKKGEWVSGKEAKGLYHQAHGDQALNQLIEVNAKDIYLRGTIVELELCEKRQPIVLEYGPDPEQPELLSEGAEGAEGAEEDVATENSEAGESAAEKFSGFIRPLNVEPRMPPKKVESEEVVDKV